MAIQAIGVSAISVGQLLTQPLRIPAYQRPYSWRPATALQLVDDIREAHSCDASAIYVVGAVILHDNDGVLEVVDGQQRLLTLRMAFALLQDEDLLDESGDAPVLQVWRELKRRLGQWDAREREALLHYASTRCQLVRIVTNDVDEAFRVFDSQNYRGKPLAPHDLLKAHHLREMRSESDAMQVAVVQAWESVADSQLDRLFSTFLYRIARWSRGESAPGFSIHDIGMFKGLSSKTPVRLPPSARYHLAAQAAAPLLGAWGTLAGEDERNLKRCRFQLDAPLVAGRPFFEMVAFMLSEVARLEGEVRTRFHPFLPPQSRYQYVHDLLVAALLYYTNKFGEEAWDETPSRLFAWAYGLRVELLRVQFASVDNLARGRDGAASPFTALRHAMTGKAIRRLERTSVPPNPRHEQELVSFIQRHQTP